MVKTLQKHGNSLALVLEKPLLEMLNINAETPLQIQVSNGSLIVTPTQVGIPESEVTESLSRLRPRYKRMLDHLAE
jgi:antitoxin component of MazEF toxin-antitoxin module